MPLLRGETDTCHEAVYTSCHSGNGPGRIAIVPSLITVTTPRYTAIFGPAPHQPELYDRQRDPEQWENLAGSYPDLVEQLRADLVAFMRAQGADEDYITHYAQGQ